MKHEKITIVLTKQQYDNIFVFLGRCPMQGIHEAAGMMELVNALQSQQVEFAEDIEVIE